MMHMLFLCLSYIAFCCLKNSYVLFDGLSENTYWNGLALMIDLSGIPLMASFFAEVVSPGMVTRRKVLIQFCAQAVFVPMYAIFPSTLVMHLALFSACLGIVVSLVIGFFLLFRHRKFIRDNYSYTEHVDVNWAINFAVVLAVMFVGFVMVVTHVTWMGRTMFYLCMMLSWIYLNNLARRHSVVNIPPLVMFAFPIIKKHEDPAPVNDVPEYSSEDASGVSIETYAVLAEQLENCMAERKLYLNPKLTLQEVCSEIGTNRTYLSDYLNKVLKTTFYEYINGLRIARACEIIDAMTPENKQSMLEVSEISGFNSISTFNRAFAKVMGQTPSHYAAKKK